MELASFSLWLEENREGESSFTRLRRRGRGWRMRERRGEAFVGEILTNKGIRVPAFRIGLLETRRKVSD